MTTIRNVKDLDIGRPMSDIRGDLTIPGATLVLEAIIEPPDVYTACRPRTLHDVRVALDRRTHHSRAPWNVYTAWTVIQSAAIKMGILEDRDLDSHRAPYGDTEINIMPGVLALIAGTTADPIAHSSRWHADLVDNQRRDRITKAFIALAENTSGDLLMPHYSMVQSEIRLEDGTQAGNDPLFWYGSRLVTDAFHDLVPDMVPDLVPNTPVN